MKKRITLTLTAILALVVSIICASSAFAAENIKWYFEYEDGTSDYSEFLYGGSVTLGDNEIQMTEDSSCICYKFEVENSGYYILTTKWDDYINIDFPEKIIPEGLYGYNWDYLYNYDEELNISQYLIYFEKGSTYFKVYTYEACTLSTLNIDYAGSEIEDIEFEKDTFSDVLIGWDFGEYEYDYDYDYILYDIDFTVKFTSGKTFAAKDTYIDFSTVNGEEIKEGENKIIIGILDFEKEITMTACTINKYIDKVELSNYENYTTVTQYYYGYFYNDINDEILTVYFKDGSSQVFDVDWGEAGVELPNGKKVYIYGNYNIDGDTAELVFYMSNYALQSYKCEIVKLDTLENISLCHSYAKELIRDGLISLKDEYANYIYCSDSLELFAENLPVFLENIANTIFWVVSALNNNAAAFICYVIG